MIFPRPLIHGSSCLGKTQKSPCAIKGPSSPSACRFRLPQAPHPPPMPGPSFGECRGPVTQPPWLLVSPKQIRRSYPSPKYECTLPLSPCSYRVPFHSTAVILSSRTPSADPTQSSPAWGLPSSRELASCPGTPSLPGFPLHTGAPTAGYFGFLFPLVPDNLLGRENALLLQQCSRDVWI